MKLFRGSYQHILESKIKKIEIQFSNRIMTHQDKKSRIGSIKCHKRNSGYLLICFQNLHIFWINMGMMLDCQKMLKKYVITKY